MKETFKKQYKLYLFAILCTVLWGSAIPSIKIGYGLFEIMPDATADKLLFAGIRFFGAGSLILIPFLGLGPQRLISRETAKQSMILGLIQTAGQYCFMYIGLAYTSGINASVINSAGTLLCVVMAWIVFRDEKLTKRKLLGCIVGFSGILLNSISSQKMGMLTFRGDGLLVLSNVCFAVGFLYSKHSVKKTNPFLLTGLQMTIGGGALLMSGFIMGGDLPQITLRGCLLLFYLMIVSAVAFSLWTMLLREYPPALVGMFHFLTPVFGSLFSCLFNAWGILNDGSAFTVYTVLAVVCAAAGIFLSSVGKASSKNGNS
jgi:drug/metabolite transporter (DMT)-like permease